MSPLSSFSECGIEGGEDAGLDNGGEPDSDRVRGVMGVELIVNIRMDTGFSLRNQVHSVNDTVCRPLQAGVSVQGGIDMVEHASCNTMTTRVNLKIGEI